MRSPCSIVVSLCQSLFLHFYPYFMMAYEITSLSVCLYTPPNFFAFYIFRVVLKNVGDYFFTEPIVT
jgi:hypothetical protein